ncbi:adhesion G protein-coupled receptor E1-like [Garra rufa]|uniref:adhesion G protein-coupled receptor E1-like n=1 Tax=Garra rufa TaxID=137080 RepID=UPI003CCE56C8
MTDLRKLRQKMCEAQLSFESVTEKWQQNQQKVKGQITSVIDTPGLSTNEQIMELVEQFKEDYHVLNNRDEEKRSLTTKLIEKTDSTVEENREQHYMYKEAQRGRLEVEEKLGLEEPLSLTQKATLFGAANLSDPCYNYTVLDEPWRAFTSIPRVPAKCDRSVTWSGWYRLFMNSVSAHIPETCVTQNHCGTYAALSIPGGHPTVEDGVVTREACAQWSDFCCYTRSFPIKVKACPGNYYVYELVKPTRCDSAYCADVSSINTSSTAVTPATISTVYPSVDPCYNYTVLDDQWRANSSQPSNPLTKCDRCITWSGWYRLFINGVSTRIQDKCVEVYSCGALYPLWIRGGHPTIEDGVVTRDVCGHWDNYCCYYGSYPIKVKACPGNYYVYELVTPTIYQAAYCAGINITLQEGCTSQTSGGCFQNLFEQIENITAQVLPLDTVENILNMVMNTSEKIVESSAANSSELASYGNRVLKANEKLVSTLVKPTGSSDRVSFALAAVEGQVFMVGPQVTLEKIPRLDTTSTSVDIDLIGIAKNNIERSAAVAFMSYNTMEDLLKPGFFNTPKDTNKTMMSTVISVTLPKTTNTKLTKPVNFTFKHIREFDPSGSLSCVYWNISEWIVDGCSVLETNSSYTVCSCDHLSTFALIMQINRPPESDSQMDLLNLVCVIVGLVFFILALLSFVLCQWSPGVNNVARINICISLLLAHLLFLLTQQFLSVIRPQQVLCAVISGLLHFLFLSGFVWMFIEAVMLFICVRNLSKISSRKKELLSSGYLCVIGYLVALVVVCVSVGLVPEGYGSEQCWIKMDKGFIWSFLGPVCIILASNMILFIKIVISLSSALKNLNAEVSQMKQTKILVFKTLAQFVVLGCSWILGFFTNDSKVLEILFLILNSQQGTFIFLIYCVLNNEVRQQYRKFFRCLCCVKKP